MSTAFILSKKYKDFLRTPARAEFLEGTTYAGKTTVGVVKWMLRVAQSDKKLHVLSGLDKGTIEKNIINKDNGILDVFGSVVDYNPSGKGEHTLPHIEYKTKKGTKIIYVLGYDDKSRWKKALGGQYGCLYIDEINIADMEYVREAAMRCDYFMATLNPDNPSLPVYKEYVNCARPIEKYKDDAPLELLRELKEEPKDGWVWWYFSFDHNDALDSVKRQQIIDNVPAGTKQYKNKIQGLRGKAVGLVFPNFSSRHILSKAVVKEKVKNGDIEFTVFTAGLDTSYSSKSPDTISMLFAGITKNRELIILDEKVYNNKDLTEPIAPSDTARNFYEFLERNRNEWGFARNVFIDSADQATIKEINKFKRNNPCAYTFNDAWKKMKIIDRINLQLGWLQKEHYLVLDVCRNHIDELENYAWDEKQDNTPEDRGDHTINASQYAWLPFVSKIGVSDEHK